MSNVCQYCFGTDLEVHNGALVCVACGQQQQVWRDVMGDLH